MSMVVLTGEFLQGLHDQCLGVSWHRGSQAAHAAAGLKDRDLRTESLSSNLRSHDFMDFSSCQAESTSSSNPKSCEIVFRLRVTGRALTPIRLILKLFVAAEHEPRSF